MTDQAIPFNATYEYGQEQGTATIKDSPEGCYAYYQGLAENILAALQAIGYDYITEVNTGT